MHEARPRTRHQALRRTLRLLDGVHVHPAALHHGTTEEPRGGGRPEQHGDAEGPCRLAEDRDVAGIATEDGDVVAHPGQRGQLVVDAPIADKAVRAGQVAVTEKTQCAEPVIDGHHHGVAVAHEVAAPVEEDRPAARGEASPVDEHHHGPAAAGLVCRRHRKLRGPDVQREAILAVWFRRLGVGGARDAGHGGRLWRDGSEGRRVPDLVPRLGCLRWSPPQLADGGLRIGDARERPQVSTPDAPEPTLTDGHDSLHARHPMDGDPQGQS